jgi:hypothetical protein
MSYLDTPVDGQAQADVNRIYDGDPSRSTTAQSHVSEEKSSTDFLIS